MKRQWIGLFVAVGFATSAVLGAQDRPSPANTPPADAAAPPGIQKPALPAPAAQPKGNTVTISGCIQDTPMVTASAAKSGDAPAAAVKAFYLNNATMAADAGRPAVGTSGLSSTGYRLDGDTEKLSPHLNHQVRIVGTVNTSSASAAGAAAQTLKVDSVTMVSAKCEPATAAKPQ
jgi:hypothetical protein